MPIDNRLLRVGIEVNNEMRYYDTIKIDVDGTKTSNPLENECTVKITNLSKDVRDYILTETSPFLKSKTPKQITIEAGRESYGYTPIYIGDIVSATISQPPDIMVTIKAGTKNSAKGKVVSKSHSGKTSIKTIAKGMAKDLNLTPIIQVKDKTISNFHFTGANTKQVEAMQNLGGVDAYIDDNHLVVKTANVPLSGQSITLNLDSGMIGIPEITEQGIKVKFLFLPNVTLGGALAVESVMNPAANGTYCIYKLAFDLSNRDTNFYYTAEAKRL